jgi:hypothetical protein
MKLNRRIFLSVLFFAKPMRLASLEVEVLETFDLDGRSVAILAHHSDAKSREQFAQWLQSNPKKTVQVRTNDGFVMPATVFRVRMCFGRALILLSKPVQVRERDLLTIVQ